MQKEISDLHTVLCTESLDKIYAALQVNRFSSNRTKNEKIKNHKSCIGDFIDKLRSILQYLSQFINKISILQ